MVLPTVDWALLLCKLTIKPTHRPIWSGQLLNQDFPSPLTLSVSSPQLKLTRINPVTKIRWRAKEEVTDVNAWPPQVLLHMHTHTHTNREITMKKRRNMSKMLEAPWLSDWILVPHLLSHVTLDKDIFTVSISACLWGIKAWHKAYLGCLIMDTSLTRCCA